MQCLILAGGLGTRMREVSSTVPKALLPIGSKTFLDWQLLWLKRRGVDEVILCLGHQGDQIEKHVNALKGQREYPNVKIIYDGDKLLGTGGAIKNALPLLSDNFLVTYGDSFLPFAVEKLFELHVRDKNIATFSIYHNKNSGDKSNVVYSKNRIELYSKKTITGEMEYIDYGMMALNREGFKKETQGLTSFDLADPLSMLSIRAQLKPYVVTTPFFEIGSPSGYKNLCNLFREVHDDLLQLENKFK